MVEIEYINKRCSEHLFKTQQECYDFINNNDDDFVEYYTIRKVNQQIGVSIAHPFFLHIKHSMTNIGILDRLKLTQPYKHTKIANSLATLAQAQRHKVYQYTTQLRSLRSLRTLTPCHTHCYAVRAIAPSKSISYTWR